MKKAMILGFAIMMAFTLTIPAVHAQQQDSQSGKNVQWQCPRLANAQGDWTCPRLKDGGQSGWQCPGPGAGGRGAGMRWRNGQGPNSQNTAPPVTKQ